MRAKTRFISMALLGLAPFLALAAACSAQQTDSGSTPTGASLGSTSSHEEGRFQIPPNALQVARIIGIDADVTRLSALPPAKDSGVAPVPSLEELVLRQRITEAVVLASLDADSALGELGYEREQMVELRSILRARRDRAIGNTNLAVLAAGTGLGVVGGLLSLSKTTSETGNDISFAAGGISTFFSLRSFRQIRGGRRPGWVLPDMLAAFFSQPEEQHSHYSEDVWAYLNSAPPGGDSKTTRKERLLENWKAANRLGPTDSPKVQSRITLLTSTNAADKRLDIELMNQRAAMLADVSDEIVQMKHDLADLLRSLRNK